MHGIVGFGGLLIEFTDMALSYTLKKMENDLKKEKKSAKCCCGLTYYEFTEKFEKVVKLLMFTKGWPAYFGYMAVLYSALDSYVDCWHQCGFVVHNQVREELRCVELNDPIAKLIIPKDEEYLPQTMAVFELEFIMFNTSVFGICFFICYRQILKILTINKCSTPCGKFVTFKVMKNQYKIHADSFFGKHLQDINIFGRTAVSLFISVYICVIINFRGDFDNGDKQYAEAAMILAII